MTAVKYHVVVALILLGESSLGFRIQSKSKNKTGLSKKLQQEEFEEQVGLDSLEASAFKHSVSGEETSVGPYGGGYAYVPLIQDPRAGQQVLVPNPHVRRVPSTMSTVSTVSHSFSRAPPAATVLGVSSSGAATAPTSQTPLPVSGAVAAPPPTSSTRRQGYPSGGLVSKAAPSIVLSSSRTAPVEFAPTQVVAAAPPSEMRLGEGQLPEQAHLSGDIPVVVEVRGKKYTLEKVSGQGSFGRVCRARTGDGHVVGIKFAKPDERKRDAYDQAMTEVALLQQATDLVRGSVWENHLSGFISVDQKRLGGSPVHMLWIVMAYTEGGDIEGTLPKLKTRSIKRALLMTGNLLTQMAGLFARLGQVMKHRDVNPRNILVDKVSLESNPHFVLIDFGLGVPNDAWHAGWRTINIAGDPRYWTFGAWERAVIGDTAEETKISEQSVLANYVNRLDHFGLGLTALEMFFAVSGDSLRSPELVHLKGKLMDYFRLVRDVHRRMFSGRPFDFKAHMRGQGRGKAGESRLDELKTLMEELDNALLSAANAEELEGGVEIVRIMERIYQCMGVKSADSWQEIAGSAA